MASAMIGLRRGLGRRFLAAIDELHARRDPRLAADWRRPVGVLLAVAVCLLLIQYLRLRDSFEAALALTGLERPGPRWHELAVYLWWGFWHLVGYVLIPVAVIAGLAGERLRDHGLGLGALPRHAIWYVLLAAPILVFVAIASTDAAFQRQYPFYAHAGRSWFDLLVWEVIYLGQFAALEFFFRGFMLFSLQRCLGVVAVPVMVVPYLMIHFPKPWPEALGAVGFGFCLGVLALRSRSIWGGVAVHATVAASMDVAALMRGAGLPSAWWP